VTTSHDAPRQPAPGVHALPPVASELETTLAAVELAIATLGQSLTQPDPVAIEAASTVLQGAMRAAMTQFAQVARRGTVPAALRSRFALANGQVGALREALFRATAVVDQHLEIMFPRPMAETSVYSATGTSGRGPGRVIAAS
jgi:hypothetical protein